MSPWRFTLAFHTHKKRGGRGLQFFCSFVWSADAVLKKTGSTLGVEQISNLADFESILKWRILDKFAKPDWKQREVYSESTSWLRHLFHLSLSHRKHMFTAVLHSLQIRVCFPCYFLEWHHANPQHFYPCSGINAYTSQVLFFPAFIPILGVLRKKLIKLFRPLFCYLIETLIAPTIYW